MKRLALWFGLVTVLSLVLGTGQAHAQVATVTSPTTLGVGNQQLIDAGETGPYGTVTWSNYGSNALNPEVQVTVDVTSPVSTATFNDFSFNTSKTVTVDSSSVLPSGWTLTADPSKSTDGFGKFSYILGNGGNSSSTGTLTFILDGMSATNFSRNSLGNAFALHWFPNNGGATGFAGDVLSVPEPGPLLGAGVVTLMGLGYSWRRRKRATA